MKKFLLIYIIFTGIAANSQTLDTTYGSTGIISNQFSVIPSSDRAHSAAMQSDEKMVYVGRGGIGTTTFISRRNTDGSPDNTFNFTGFRKISSSVNDNLFIQSNGKILVGGSNILIRLNTDGSFDNTFNNDGNVSIFFDLNNMFIKSFIELNNGKILVGGYVSNGNNNDFAVVKLNADGSLDTTFGTQGKAMISVGTNNDEAYDMCFQQDGKIVMTGQTYNGSNYDFATVRLNSNGTLDLSFGTSGKAIVQFSSNDYARSVAIQDDGKIIILGSGTTTKMYVIRYNTDGTLDSTFDGDGIVQTTTTLSTSTSTSTSATISKPKIKLLTNGKILISGTSGLDFGLFQLNSNGSFDTAFGVNGKVIYDFFQTDISNFLIVKPNGKIIIGGGSTDAQFANKVVKLEFSATGTFEDATNFTLDNGLDTINVTLEQSSGKTISLCDNRGVGFNLRRFNVDGSIDINFGNSGIVNLSNLNVYKMILVNDAILICNKPTDGNSGLLYKFTINGAIDNSFGMNGIINFSSNVPATTPIYVNTINEIFYNPADGFTYFGFNYNENANNSSNLFFSYGISRMNNSGTIDTSFGVNGISKYRFDYMGTSSDEFPSEIIIQSDGKIIVSGLLNTASGISPINYIIGVLRLNPNGSLDTTFGTSGKIVTQINSQNFPSDMVLLPNDKFIINSTDTNAGNFNSYSIQYNSNGILDTNYGTNGIVNDLNYFKTMSLQPDGKIIKGGQFDNHFEIVRYNINGTLDTTFGTSGFINTIVNLNSDINTLTLLNNSKLLAGGYSYNGTNYVMSQARYTNTTLGTLNFNSTKNSFLVYPNPIENEATFEYTLQDETKVSIDIVDLQGKVIKTFVTNQTQSKGNHQQNIDLSDIYSSGNYFIRFTSPLGIESVQIIKK